ncbi:acyloxyacyl hydrolase [Algoriphagus namhaensis]
MKRALLISFLLGFSFSLFAQEKYQKSITVSYETGPFTSTGEEWSEQLNELIEYRALDLRLGFRERTPGFYQQLYRNPTFGVGFTSALPYFREIGRPMAVYGFLESSFGQNPKKRALEFGWFGQLGLGFNANPFDAQDNPLNNYLGSPINAYVHLGINAKYKLSPKFDLVSSVGLKHYSNGASTKPNKGLNMIPISVGIRSNLGGEFQKPSESIEYPDLEKRGFWNLALYLGAKNYEIGDPTYFRGGLGVNYLWEASYKYRLGLGVDMFYADGLDKRFPDGEFNFFDRASFALVGSWEWKLTQHLYVPIALGVYVHRTELNQEITQYYERIGVGYRMDNLISAAFSIKAHKAKADFFEFTLGYTIPGKVKYIRAAKHK